MKQNWFELAFFPGNGLLIEAWEQITDKVPSHESHFIFFSPLLRLVLISCSPLITSSKLIGEKKPDPACDPQRERLKRLPSPSHLKSIPLANTFNSRAKV